LEDSFIVEELKKYSRSLRAKEQSVSKIYMLDNGLLSVNGVSEGKLFENAVFNTLYRIDNIKLSYYRDQSAEVDFVISKNGTVKALIQASYSISDFATRERELKALAAAAVKLNCNNLYLVTMNEDKVERHKGKRIVVLPLWKFMLHQNFKLAGVGTT
jgi:predicted AAA+ superfamily ATPase